MRYGCVVSLMLISSAVTGSAQDQFSALTRQKEEVRVSPDDVIARLMSFDSNRDGVVATSELSERMQVLVARGDRSGDGALDAAEIRSLTQSPPFVATALRNRSGGYSFGDTVGQSSRTHIENTIEDLRLAPQANVEARRVALAFADELEGTALANLRSAVSPMLTETQLAEFEANVKRNRNRVITMLSHGSEGARQTFVISAAPIVLLGRYQLTPEQQKVAAAAAETFKAEQQLDDARRSALVARVSSILTEEERENFSAALARRPLVRGLGPFVSAEATIREFPGNGVPVREIGFTAGPVAPTSR